jgi:anthocyanidin reductase
MVDKLELIEAASGSIPLVHIDDVCGAEIFVAEAEAPAGRYIVCTLNTTAIELANFLHAKYPQYELNIDQYVLKLNLPPLHMQNAFWQCVTFCLHCSIGALPEKPRVSIWSDKLQKEGFQYKYNNLDQVYDDIVPYGKKLGILPK